MKTVKLSFFDPSEIDMATVGNVVTDLNVVDGFLIASMSDGSDKQVIQINPDNSDISDLIGAAIQGNNLILERSDGTLIDAGEIVGDNEFIFPFTLTEVGLLSFNGEAIKSLVTDIPNSSVSEDINSVVLDISVPNTTYELGGDLLYVASSNTEVNAVSNGDVIVPIDTLDDFDDGGQVSLNGTELTLSTGAYYISGYTSIYQCGVSECELIDQVGRTLISGTIFTDNGGSSILNISGQFLVTSDTTVSLRIKTENDGIINYRSDINLNSTQTRLIIWSKTFIPSDQLDRVFNHTILDI